MLQRKFPASIGPLCWAPQGRRLMFVDVETTPVRSTLWELEVDTKATRRVLPNEWWRVQSLAAAPDGSGVVASLVEPVQAPQVWYLPFEGTPRKLTSRERLRRRRRRSILKSVVTSRADEGRISPFISTGPIRCFVTSGPQRLRGSRVRGLPRDFRLSSKTGRETMAMRADDPIARCPAGIHAWSPIVSRDGAGSVMSSTGGTPEVWTPTSRIESAAITPRRRRRPTSSTESDSIWEVGANWLPGGKKIAADSFHARRGPRN